MSAPTTTAQQVFDITMGLIDEVNGSSGATDTADTREYRVRALYILNALRGELYPYSDTYTAATDGSRPIAPAILAFDGIIQLDDHICQSVLPYGLAAQLLLGEDPSSASFFQQRYEELRDGLTKGFPKSSESIVDVYGVCTEYNEFSRW